MRTESETSGPGAPGKTVYDSTSGAPPDAASQSAAAMIGEPITIIMSPSGVIEKVEGMSRIMEKVMAGQNAGAGLLGFDLRQSFSERA